MYSSGLLIAIAGGPVSSIIGADFVGRFITPARFAAGFCAAFAALAAFMPAGVYENDLFPTFGMT